MGQVNRWIRFHRAFLSIKSLLQDNYSSTGRNPWPTPTPAMSGLPIGSTLMGCCPHVRNWKDALINNDRGRGRGSCGDGRGGGRVGRLVNLALMPP